MTGVDVPWMGRGSDAQKILFKDRTEYRYKGRLHNPYGPAVIYGSGLGKFYLDGIEVTPEHHEVHRIAAVRTKKVIALNKKRDLT